MLWRKDRVLQGLRTRNSTETQALLRFPADCVSHCILLDSDLLSLLRGILAVISVYMLLPPEFTGAKHCTGRQALPVPPVWAGHRPQCGYPSGSLSGQWEALHRPWRVLGKRAGLAWTVGSPSLQLSPSECSCGNGRNDYLRATVCLYMCLLYQVVTRVLLKDKIALSDHQGIARTSSY